MGKRRASARARARVRHQIDVFCIHHSPTESITWKIIHQKFMLKVCTLVFVCRHRRFSLSADFFFLQTQRAPYNKHRYAFIIGFLCRLRRLLLQSAFRILVAVRFFSFW